MVALVGVITACSGGTASSPAASAAAAASPAPTPVETVNTDLLADLDIGGGRKMHILCVGPIVAGKPTVIFESGLGGDASQWQDVLHELDGSVRACAYDRAGDGQSAPVAGGRTTKDQVADLRALLAAAKVPPPYLLVGYSLGGWNAMVHADMHPEDVVGAVMAEVRPPAASREWAKLLPPRSATESETIAGIRDEVTTFDTDPTLNPEGLKLGESASQAIATKGFGAKPLIVLAAADTTIVSEGLDAALGAKFVDVWWTLQDELADRSSKGRLEKVTDVTHEMIFERPGVVVDAIHEALGI
jgi:pimeloyl-ACP methyl ester carboxylesterase